MGQKDCEMGMITNQIVLDTAIVKNKLQKVICTIRWIPVGMEISYLAWKTAKKQAKAGRS